MEIVERMQAIIITVLACLVASAQSFQSIHQSKMLCRRSIMQESPQSVESTTIVVPRYYPYEIPDGHYPSPLHKIHVIPFLTDEETTMCLQIANDYADRTGCWSQPDRMRHAAYSTCDFPVEDCQELQTYLEDIGFRERMFRHLENCYGVSRQDMDYLDFFVANYQSNPATDGLEEMANRTPGKYTTTMDRLEEHRDGSILSFTITLSEPDSFVGGGTFFEALRNAEDGSGIVRPNGVVRPNRAGDAVLHSGKLLHGADVVRSGSRTVMVGFIDIMDWWIKPGTLSQACTDWGRLDVALNRLKRHDKKTKHGKKGWFLNNSKWLPRKPGRSHLQGYYPAVAFRKQVENRTNKEYQRLKRLEAEDKLLRTILETEDSSKMRKSELQQGYEIC